MHRRTLLQLAGASSVVTAGGLWWYLLPAPLSHDANPGGVLVPFYEFGQEVDLLLQQMTASSSLLNALPAEHALQQMSLDELLQRLRAQLNLDVQEPTARQFRSALQKKLASEHGNGDIIEMDGWQLAKTELLLAAISHKLHPTTVHSRDNSKPAHIADISNWGPRQTTQGVPPNSFGQEGFSALWFDIQDVPPWLEIAIDGTRLRCDYREQRVLVASFQGQLDFQQQLFNTAGEHSITLHDDVAGTWQQLASFTVLPATDSAGEADGLCTVSNWGPQKTGIQQIANMQSNGNLGIWVDIACAPSDTIAVIGPQQLTTYQNKPGVLTFGVPAELLQIGRMPIVLQSLSTGQQRLLGELEVTED
ncbi:MAG: hypothetical protein Tsb0027_17900 [Wenzhouxiangellaceae bacterium]